MGFRVPESRTATTNIPQASKEPEYNVGLLDCEPYSWLLVLLDTLYLCTWTLKDQTHNQQQRSSIHTKTTRTEARNCAIVQDGNASPTSKTSKHKYMPGAEPRNEQLRKWSSQIISACISYRYSRYSDPRCFGSRKRSSTHLHYTRNLIREPWGPIASCRP